LSNATVRRDLLSECRRDGRNGYEQKQVKRASKKMRCTCGANVCFHLACASVRKHLLLDVLQSCRDNLTGSVVRFFFIDKAMGAVAG
jgi:hypothetical protein